MIHYIKGNVAMTFDGGIAVEAGGIGYKVFVPDNSPLYSKNKDELIVVYTVMIVREDDMSLYGFHDKESLELFQLLRTVNGVGAKVAMSALSSIAVNHIKRAIVCDDPKTLMQASGIGKKTAQRIVLELKDKIGDYEDLASLTKETPSGGAKTEAVNALMGLGYSRSEAVSAVGSVEGHELNVEEYIRLALRKPVK